MGLLASIGIVIAVTAITIIIILRKRTDRSTNAIYDEIVNSTLIKIHTSKTEYDSSELEPSNLKLYLAENYKGKYITANNIEEIKSQFEETANKVKEILFSIKTFKIRNGEHLKRFFHEYTQIHKLIDEHNQAYIQEELTRNESFFAKCLKYPLDEQQRRAIVSAEENCLVISSAGSGKTSSIIGKIKYLIEKKGINPNRILLISFTNKAANELTIRAGIEGLRGYTFHKLALDIIAKTTGTKPSICENTDPIFINIHNQLLKEKTYRDAIIDYFNTPEANADDAEIRKEMRRQELSKMKEKLYPALLPDMDGNKIYVHSEEEQKICFALSVLGVNFRYEEKYEFPLADEKHRQYQPDFSIYYKENGETKRAYLEHFGVDEHGLVPIWFAKDSGVSYEEANRKYNDGITWKKAAHKKFGTKLITTSSGDLHSADIRLRIKQLLTEAGIPIFEKSDTEIYELILPPQSKQEKAFIRLAVTFITLLKSNQRSIEDVIKLAIRNGDDRSKQIIKKIFKPIYEKYIYELNKLGKIDFTDAILQATEICLNNCPVHYDYIIVDEFQDISIDRYNFLKSLKEGKNRTKLYCVGDDWQSIYRFSGSDMALLQDFPKFFGPTDITKIETTYRFGQPLIESSSHFIQRNKAQIIKNIQPFDFQMVTDIQFVAYEPKSYCNEIGRLTVAIPKDRSVLLLGRYSFDDYYLSYAFKSVKEGNRFYYIINNRKIEFLTVHKSKGLEADYVIVLQCNKDIYGFPSLMSDDPVLNYVLATNDQYPFAEERRLFYVAITRARHKTFVLYDKRFPSMFVDEFLNPDSDTGSGNKLYPNANKRWTHKADDFMVTLYNEGKSIKYIANKMGRSQTAIIMRLGKLLGN